MVKVKQSREMRIAEFNIPATISKSEVAKQLGVSRAYVTMLAHGKGAVAQLGERLPCTEEVRGSNPLSSTKGNHRQNPERLLHLPVW